MPGWVQSCKKQQIWKKYLCSVFFWAGTNYWISTSSISTIAISTSVASTVLSPPVQSIYAWCYWEQINIFHFWLFTGFIGNFTLFCCKLHYDVIYTFLVLICRGKICICAIQIAYCISGWVREMSISSPQSDIHFLPGVGQIFSPDWMTKWRKITKKNSLEFLDCWFYFQIFGFP